VPNDLKGHFALRLNYDPSPFAVQVGKTSLTLK